MPGQCTNAVKAARAHEAQALAARMHLRFLEESVGQTLPVLFESGEEGSLGHSDTYLLVKVPDTGLQGQLLPVRITGIDGEKAIGEIRSSEFGIESLAQYSVDETPNSRAKTPVYSAGAKPVDPASPGQPDG